MLNTCTRCCRGDVQLDRRGLCRNCYQALWRAGLLTPLPAKPRTPRTTRECAHPGKPHRHGTRVAYVQDKCRCDPCTDANQTRQAQARRVSSIEKWHPEAGRFVNGDAVRAHLAGLRKAGMGRRQIAAVSGVSLSTLCGILHGVHPGDPTHPDHRPPRRKVSREIAERLLAVTAVSLAAGAVMDATGSVRRLRALAAAGWTRRRLAGLVGVEESHLGQLVNGAVSSVLVSTAARVSQVYDQCWQGPPPPVDRWQAAAISRAKAEARRLRWAPAMAWDDEEIDAPAAVPHLGDTATREQVVVETVEDLLDAGEHPEAIAARLGVRYGSLQVSLGRYGRKDLWDRLVAAKARALREDVDDQAA